MSLSPISVIVVDNRRLVVYLEITVDVLMIERENTREPLTSTTLLLPVNGITRNHCRIFIITQTI